jgi:hypothetical protein
MSKATVPVFTMNQFTYLSDISDMIDMYMDEAKKRRDRAFKAHCLEAARRLVLLYETHIGRKVYKKI